MTSPLVQLESAHPWTDVTGAGGKSTLGKVPGMSKAVIAVAALVRDGRVLMVHRHPDRRWYPNCWDLIGGHVEPGESPERAVIRECLEEVNIRVFNPRPIPMSITDPAIEMHAFVVDRWDGEPVNAAPDEHDGLSWFGPSELERLTLAHPASRQDILRLTRGSQASPSPG